MKRVIPAGRATAVLLFVAAALAPAMAAAQTAPAATAETSSGSSETDKWHLAVGIYGYLPAIDGTVNFPGDAAGSDIHVPFSKLWDNLKMVADGYVDVHKGHWGGYADVIYMDVGSVKSLAQDFPVGGGTIPGGTTLSLDVKATVLTFAGEYRVVSDPKWTVDALLGTRMLYHDIQLGYSVGALAGKKQSLSTEWDGVVGVKGRYGERLRWFVPFYLDVGTGETKLTWQASGGLGYAWRHTEVVVLYRYLDWEGKSTQPLSNLSFSGPEVGFAYHF